MHEAIDIHAANATTWSMRKESLQFHHHNHHGHHHHHASKGQVKSPVSRAITFGSPLSREKVSKFMKEQMDSLRLMDKKRWNYDFCKDRPGSPGSNYEWKKGDERTDSLGYSFYGFKHTSAPAKNSNNNSITCHSSSHFKK